MAHDVFISHSAKDKAIADAMCATLEASGIRCWIAPRDVVPGKTWAAAIHEAIRASRAFVLVFSAESNGSPQVLREIDQAVKAEVAILPFRLDGTVAAPELDYYLGTAHWLDALSPPLEAHLRRLSHTLQALVAAPPHPARAASVATRVAAPPSRGVAWMLRSLALTNLLYGVAYCLQFVIALSDLSGLGHPASGWQFVVLVLAGLLYATSSVGILVRDPLFGRTFAVLSAGSTMVLASLVVTNLASEGWRGSPEGVALGACVGYVIPILSIVLLFRYARGAFVREAGGAG